MTTHYWIIHCAYLSRAGEGPSAGRGRALLGGLPGHEGGGGLGWWGVLGDDGMAQVVLPGADGGGQVGQASPPPNRGP